MAGMDATMLALTGAGYTDGRIFGFAACERNAGAAEGVNVLMQRRLSKPDGTSEYAYNITNVEYTEFERLGLTEEKLGTEGASILPANTNILYVSLKVTSIVSNFSSAICFQSHNRRQSASKRQTVIAPGAGSPTSPQECCPSGSHFHPSGSSFQVSLPELLNLAFIPSISVDQI